jgi:hypothetical protein
MVVGFLAGIFATFIAVVVGVTAGYVSGGKSEALSALTNVFLVIPGLPLIIIVASQFEDPDVVLIAGVLAITGWAWGARVLRAQTMSLRNRDFIQAARVNGEPLFRIIAVEMLPNLLAVIASLVRGDEKSGAQLLLKAVTVWTTNVIAFGLWYWAFDRGGPARRLKPDPPPPDFQFPQLENPQLAALDWQPELVDYVYVSFTNSIAFSPTDAMPLSRWAKLLMLTESALSSITVLLVAARAVNIFK